MDITRLKGRKGRFVRVKGENNRIRYLKYYSKIAKEKYEEWAKLKRKQLRQQQKEYLERKIGEERTKRMFRRLHKRIKRARNITEYLKKGATNSYSGNIKEIKENERKAYGIILSRIARKKRYIKRITNNIEKIKENIEHEITINGTNEKGNPVKGTIIARGKTINQIIKELEEEGIKEGNKIDYLQMQSASEGRHWTAYDCPTKAEESIYVNNITLKTTIISGWK